VELEGSQLPGQKQETLSEKQTEAEGLGCGYVVECLPSRGKRQRALSLVTRYRQEGAWQGFRDGSVQLGDQWTEEGWLLDLQSGGGDTGGLSPKWAGLEKVAECSVHLCAYDGPGGQGM
jgi:hypothetical protein